jgi:hypothetical protein
MPRKKSAPSKEPPQTINFDAAKKAEVLAKNAGQLAEFAAIALVAAESMGIKTKPLEHFSLSPAQREVLLAVPGISKTVKTKLAKEKAKFTVADVASMTMALAEASIDEDQQRQIAILLVAKHLTERLQERIAGVGEAKLSKTRTPKPKAKSAANTVYQFKITLVGSKPPIWRRIQVEDCTLDKLHEHIQTAMGWTNSHLHQFEIFEKRYGDPELLDDGFDDSDCIDSTRTKISDITPNAGKRFSFTYEYDFGDGLEHEILFEGSPTKEPGKKYPLCLEGARACPPEDVGGIYGFYDFLEALADPKHEQHDDFIEWGGDFDPKEFDAGETTKAMKKGLPDWR